MWTKGLNSTGNTEPTTSALEASAKAKDTDTDPEWADEAFADRDAIVDSPDPASKSGKTDRRRLLTDGTHGHRGDLPA